MELLDIGKEMSALEFTNNTLSQLRQWVNVSKEESYQVTQQESSYYGALIYQNKDK